MVSPPAKNAGDVLSDAFRTRVAVSGNAVAFASLTSFGDALGAGIGSEYLSRRTGAPGTNGWTTHSLIPRRDALSFSAAVQAMDTKYEGEFSDDLNRAVMQSYTPLTNAPNVAQVSNLYLRNDALTAGAGTYELLTDCLACEGTPLTDPFGLYRPRVAAMTPDLGHVIFEASRNLTPDAPPQGFLCATLFVNCQPRLYEWDHGTLRLAGILPDGTPATRSIAGSGATLFHTTSYALSADGSRIFFTVGAAGAAEGDLYMRVDHTSTVQINASERTDCADKDPCTGAPEPDPNGAQPAGFQTASADGSKVFFTSSERLTDSPQVGLYMYDTTLPASDPHNLTVIPGAGVFGGVSDDGSIVYVYSQNPLIQGQPGFPPDDLYGIYEWHDGELTFVGSVVDVGDNVFGPSVSWVLRRRTSRVTSDGATLAFVSTSGVGLTGQEPDSHCGVGANERCAEIYLYRAENDSVVCVSCNPSGGPVTTNATYSIAGSLLTGSGGSNHINHPISDDGKHVFFETGDRLLPGDINGKKADVYEYDVPTGALHLISTGTSEDDSHFVETAQNGSDVLFTTNQRLVRWDRDNNYDLYDARVGGGFPEPVAAKPECAGDTCQGSIPTPPAIGVPSSNTFFGGSSNVVPRAGKIVVKSLTRTQKLNRALKKCKTKRKKVQRKKCESSAHKSFGRSK